MTIETNRIKEVAPGVYYVLLRAPESYILQELLDPRIPYVLCWDHNVGNYTWHEFQIPIINSLEPINARSRLLNFDFILPTQQFMQILPQMKPAIKAVQLSTLPPDYLDMRRIQGNQLYRLLNECGWHILLDTPANDYGFVMSPKQQVLEQAIKLVSNTDV